MSEMSSARAAAAATTVETSPSLREMSFPRFPNSRKSPLKLLMLSGTAAGSGDYEAHCEILESVDVLVYPY